MGAKSTYRTMTCPEENVEHYCRGKLHPAQLGDLYDGERYEILRKLGYGAFSTVWLAHDHV